MRLRVFMRLLMLFMWIILIGLLRYHEKLL
jgi:hypothetical protein